MNMVAGSTMSASFAVSVMKCSCTHDEQVLAGKALLHQSLLGSDGSGICVLDQHRLDGRAALQRDGVAGQDRARCGDWSSRRTSRVDDVEAFDQALAPMVDRAVVVERAAALVLPGARDGGDAGRRVHVGRAVALARKAVAEPEDRCAWSCRRAGRKPRSLDTGRPVMADAHSGVRVLRCASSSAGQSVYCSRIVAIREALAKQDVHHARRPARRRCRAAGRARGRPASSWRCRRCR